jgi:ribosomal protein S18 acetylase RimI-like enzyme
MKIEKNDDEVSVATEKDLQDLTTLVNSAYRGDSSRRGWTTEADFLDGQRTDPETLKNEMRRPQVFILCLRRRTDGRLQGCVFLQLFSDQKGPGCYLGMLTVEPTLQNSGIGRRLLDVSENFARSKGATRMLLGVIHLRGPLMEWYQRRGYRKTGETKPFPYGDEKAGRPRRDDLHFIMFEKVLGDR